MFLRSRCTSPVHSRESSGVTGRLGLDDSHSRGTSVGSSRVWSVNAPRFEKSSLVSCARLVLVPHGGHRARVTGPAQPRASRRQLVADSDPDPGASPQARNSFARTLRPADQHQTSNKRPRDDHHPHNGQRTTPTPRPARSCPAVIGTPFLPASRSPTVDGTRPSHALG
jgi:hypothetical protein